MGEIKLIEDEAEAELKKKKLMEEMECADEQTESKDYSSFEINWYEKYKHWWDVKDQNRELMIKNGDKRLFFLSHSHDKINGKAQLVHQTIQRIPLIRRILKIVRKKNEDAQYITQYKFIDDKFDKRYDGQEMDILAFDFWVYRVIDKGKEHYIFSEKELPDDYSSFTGMQINLDDTSDMSNSLKIKKITSIFICKDSVPNIKIINPEGLVDFVKETGWDQESFIDYLFCHEDGNIYDYTPDFNLLRVTQLLSSKYEGYPLHLFKMGPVGTGKTTEAEVLDHKFQEEQGILEAGSSRMKVMVPSFKEKPANLGYICNCNRIAIIDELMKMLEEAMSKSHNDIRITNYLGQLNMLLEQKKRMVGSGNDNSAVVHSSAKVCITTNNLADKNTIAAHVGMVDNTTLSRMLIWIQDAEEVGKVYKKDGIRKFTQGNLRTHIHHPAKPLTHTLPLPLPNSSNTKLVGSWGGVSVCGVWRDQFLTIYDSCQQFLVNFDMDRMKKIVSDSIKLTKDPMKKIWMARGLHHSILILDGITKFRCLFRDHDKTYKILEEDYLRLEELITHMIKTWDTHFDDSSWKENFK